MKTSCEICGNTLGNQYHVAREMMFGCRDEFSYMECGACGCLQNVSVPDDLGKYYGPDYYSVTKRIARNRTLYDALKGLRTGAYLSGKGLIGSMLLKKFGPPGLPDWAAHSGMQQNSRILEVGCGSGSRLLSLQSEGFTNLTGADPFIAGDIDYGRGLTIKKAYISEIPGRYEFIVLEHALEHIPAPHATLAALRALLEPNGMLIISIPLAGYAWQHYGVNWVQLDAPRHLFLHTEKSFRILTAAMTVQHVHYDSGSVQFWGSEQYVRDIPLLDPRSYRVNQAGSIFSAQVMAGFEERARELNKEKLGDQATFYLTS